MVSETLKKRDWDLIIWAYMHGVEIITSLMPRLGFTPKFLKTIRPVSTIPLRSNNSMKIPLHEMRFTYLLND